jgi:phosphoglycolate phosphatase-like HAD superfamily hydrolase
MSSREEIEWFQPTKNFFIGIDSDGTVFDSMNIKHLRAFIPSALEVWDFGEKSGEFQRRWKEINLYSQSRGINRFAALVLAFDALGAAAPGDSAPLKAFTKNSAALSNAALDEWIAAHPHPFLEAVRRWSIESDRLFEEHTRGLLPFSQAAAALRLMREKADIMVVSSASGKSLEKDWSYSGLGEYVSLSAGQEIGDKQTQLRLGAAGKYPPEKILMIGDAPGDREAADSIAAQFYLIAPGKEDESWVRLRDEALPRFFAGGIV